MFGINGQNIITNGDFKNVTSVTEKGFFYRISDFNNFGKSIQLDNPVAEEAIIGHGEWYKKSGANGSLTAQIVETTLADESTGNAAYLLKKSGKYNQNQNCLTQFFPIQSDKEYTLTFDFKAAGETTAADYDNLLYVYVRALKADNSLGKTAIGTKFVVSQAGSFTPIGNQGWYRFSRTFKSTGFETENVFFNVAVDGTILNYDYFITNVSIEERVANNITETDLQNVKVYTAGESIIIEANGSAEISDMTGRAVKTRHNLHGVTTVAVDQKGLYIVSVKTIDGIYNTKVWIK